MSSAIQDATTTGHNLLTVSYLHVSIESVSILQRAFFTTNTIERDRSGYGMLLYPYPQRLRFSLSEGVVQPFQVSCTSYPGMYPCDQTE